MVGFLGKTHVLSSEVYASQAMNPDITVLNNGQVVTVSNFGPNRSITVTMTNPKTDAHTDVFTFSPAGIYGSSRKVDEASVTWLSDGGFVVAVNIYVSFGETDLLLQRFDASGNTVGPIKTMNIGTERPTGDVDLVHTSQGYFIAGAVTAGIAQPFGRFYSANGTLLNEIALGNATGRVIGETLANGKFAAFWTEPDGQHLQVFSGRGNPQGTDILVDGTAVSIRALDGGGFAALTRAVDGSFAIQVFKNDGTKKGAAFDIDENLWRTGNIDFAETKDGNFAVSWVANPTGFNEEVMFSLYSAKGNLIVGPQVANTITTDDQFDVSFSTLKNGDLLLSYYNGHFKDFSYSNAAMGVEVVSPDYFWEGTRNDDTKAGTGGNDVLVGLKGIDTLSGGKGSDYLRGGLGNDVLNGDAGNDELVGDAGNDTLSGSSGKDLLRGGDGDDTLAGGTGSDTVWGDAGSDKINGGKGNDTLYGGDKGDTIHGDGGNDRVLGEAGNDKLYGDAGNDNLDGGDGNDFVWGGRGNDVIAGGTGKDMLSGGSDNDFLYGGDGNDILKGDAGNDTLQGDGGNDTLRGGAGDDILQGLLGNDKLFGDAGADTFQFLGGTFGHDTIRDFEFGVDNLDMSLAATQIALTGGSINIRETAAGVKFVVDADNWVLVKGAILADFQPDDYDINPIG